MDIAKFKAGETVLIKLKNHYKYIGEVETNSVAGKLIILSEGTILHNTTGEWEVFNKLNKIIAYGEIDFVQYLNKGSFLYKKYYSHKWL